MNRAMAALPKATNAMSTTQTSRSLSEKDYTTLPSGSKWRMKAWYWHTPKSKAPSLTPILSLSTLSPSFRQSLLTPYPNGSTSSSLANRPSSTCLSMLPRNWTIGALLPISLATRSTTTRWLISTPALNSSRPKWTRCGLLSCSVKGNLKPLGCPSSWHTWSALRWSLCTMQGVMMGLKLPSEGVGSVKHKVVLS